VGTPGVTVEIRALVAADAEFLGRMLYEALFWSPAKERLPIEFVLAHPKLAIFHEGWGRAGDAGFVAEVDGHPAGTAWYRLFSEAEHGDGYVDDETPELAIAVAEEHRGLGLGTKLMAAIADRARADGLTRIALAVDHDNPAKQLYIRLGYVDYEPADGVGRMLLEL
jgi:GNAT superfamily N-acetyltransferase